ncbi:uncharacterized protein [Fopius arisanus]|uniref:F-box domain-containing protein n=1 Tax=Fopius arisanus TaxID=64838 RepID=A0A9R1TD09_9HYME|nr:PREDICTED: uncharacterized protein LOC105268755 [Fopius arisanus]
MLARSMKLFGNLISLFGLGKPNLDPIANLPVEVTHSIFRMLDPNSLLNAARVSKEWFYVCRGDSHLRATARRHLRKEKRKDCSKKCWTLWTSIKSRGEEDDYSA